MKYEAEEKSACPSSLSGCPVLILIIILIPGTVVTWKEEKKKCLFECHAEIVKEKIKTKKMAPLFFFSESESE